LLIIVRAERLVEIFPRGNGLPVMNHFAFRILTDGHLDTTSRVVDDFHLHDVLHLIVRLCANNCAAS